MEYYSQVFEQLSEAGEQIDKNTPTGSRLALILTDNIFEYMMYRLVQDEFKYNHEEHEGEDFKKITNDFKSLSTFILSKLEIIQHNDFEIINICHKMRNEAYHKNILKNDIIIEVSKTYFHTCCNLLIELLPGSITMGPDDNPNSFLSELGYSWSDLRDKEKLEKIINLILKTREKSNKKLANVVSNHFIARLSTLTENLNYIQLNRTFESDEDLEHIDIILKHIQFFNDESEELEEAKRKNLKEAYNSYIPTINTSKLENWERRAARISPLNDSSKILKRFEMLNDEISDLEPKVDEMVMYYDYYIDNEIDRLRGN